MEHLLTTPAWVVLLVVFALPALESSAFLGFLFPGETAVLLGGVAASQGHVPLAAVVLAGAGGAILGDAVGYLVGRRWGRRILGSALGRFTPERHLDRAERALLRGGGWAVFLGRFTVALRVLVPGLAGMAGMRYRRFLAANVAGGTAWVALMVTAGYLAGNSWHTVEHYVTGAGAALLGGVLAVFVARRPLGRLVRATRRSTASRVRSATAVQEGTPMRNQPAAVLAAATLSLFLTGCGSSDSGSDASTSTPTAATTSISSTPTASDSPAEATYPILSQADLEAAVLTVGDLPPGYTQDPPDDSTSRSRYCGSSPTPAATRAHHSFTKGRGRATVFAQAALSQYQDAAEAKQNFDTWANGLAGCPGETVGPNTLTYEVVPTPDVGHPAVGLRISADSFSILLQAALVGPTVVTAAAGGVTSSDAALAGQLFQQQVAAYEAAATR